MFYATDINQDALTKAETGVYELDRIKLFTENHRKSGGKSSLSDYYTAAYGRASFDKSLRQRVVFSDHSLVTDAVVRRDASDILPQRADLFRSALQDRAVGLFKDSLARKRFWDLARRRACASRNMRTRSPSSRG